MNGDRIADVGISMTSSNEAFASERIEIYHGAARDWDRRRIGLWLGMLPCRAVADGEAGM
jgi:hypothetical protein